MRCKMLLPMLLSALFLLAASPVFSQAPTPPAARLEAMKKFDLWVGEWKGSGWDSPGGDRRHEFRIDEKVQRKLGGTILLVEGRSTSRTDQGQEVVTHEALALLYYDDKAGRYHWNSHDLRGGDDRCGAEAGGRWFRMGFPGRRARRDRSLHDPI